MILDFDKVKTLEDIKLVLLLMAATIAHSKKIKITQSALSDFPGIEKLCIEDESK